MLVLGVINDVRRRRSQPLGGCRVSHHDPSVEVGGNISPEDPPQVIDTRSTPRLGFASWENALRYRSITRRGHAHQSTSWTRTHCVFRSDPALHTLTIRPRQSPTRSAGPAAPARVPGG